MRTTPKLILAAAAAGALAAGTVFAQGMSDTKRVRVTYQNLTTGQGFAPSVFMSHASSASRSGPASNGSVPSAMRV